MAAIPMVASTGAKATGLTSKQSSTDRGWSLGYQDLKPSQLIYEKVKW